MAEERMPCQECRLYLETPFGLTLEGQPVALICLGCRRRVGGVQCQPTSRIECNQPTMVRVDVEPNGALFSDPLFTITWATFIKTYPRLARIFRPSSLH